MPGPRRTAEGSARPGFGWLVAVVVLAALHGGCDPGSGATPGAAPADAPDAEGAGARVTTDALRGAVARVDSASAAADDLFRPLPLLTPAQEAALRSFDNAAQLDRARRLGIGRSPTEDQLATLRRQGRLVPLEDGPYWVVGDLDHSTALVVPGVVQLLEEVGDRFHRRLATLGAPPFRMEVSSVLRSAADQAALRRVNPNAASGESAHEHGTTVDVLYSAFAAPAEPGAPTVVESAPWLEPFVARYATVAAERVAARRAMELKAVLGEVLLELQREGRVMVTLERQQPVFHMTLANDP